MKKRLVVFIKARKSDMRTNLREDTGDKRSLKKKKAYEEVTTDEEEDARPSDSLVTSLATAAPASISCQQRFDFLNALSSDENYLELVDAVKDLTAAKGNLVSID